MSETPSHMSRILYSGTKNASSWAFRAWLALKEQGIKFEERVVDIRQPQRLGNLARIAEFSPPGAVPVLVDGDAVIYDSLAIMEYANELGGGSLLPTDIKLRAQARSLVAWQHSGLSHLCPRLSFESSFYPDKRAMTQISNSSTSRLIPAIIGSRIASCIHSAYSPSTEYCGWKPSSPLTASEAL